MFWKLLVALFVHDVLTEDVNTYICNGCGREYKTRPEAKDCFKSHKIYFDKLDNNYVVDF
jgi:hypothetical protein